MLTEAQAAQFARDGFLNAGQVLSAGELAALTDALDAVIAKGPDGFAADEPRPVLFRDLAAGRYESALAWLAPAVPGVAASSQSEIVAKCESLFGSVFGVSKFTTPTGLRNPK